MFKSHKILALIPARGGSKGIPNKNLRLVNGHPLICYSIEAAKKTKIFDSIFVSTDSEKIADVAIKYGAIASPLRPAELATDSAKTIDVIISCLKNFAREGISYDYIVLLQPTSPLRTDRQISEAMELITKSDANAVVSVVETEHSPLFCNTLGADQRLDDFISNKVKGMPRQSLPTYYRLNGAIYIARVDYLLKYKDFYHKNCVAYIMDRNSSIDIDEELDLKIAELLLKEQEIHE